MKIHNEADAWRYIAEVWVTDNGRWAIGTCPLIEDLRDDRVISTALMDRMNHRLRRHLEENGSPFGGDLIAYPVPDEMLLREYVEEHREARALYALWLALEAEATS